MNKRETPKVLIVDDSPTNLMATERAMRSLDAQILTAHSGEEALRLTGKHDFALVLLDVQMPQMNGFEVASRMRAEQATPYVPIIFVTATSKDDQWVFQGYETGAVDYLFKPVNFEILRNKVQVFLELDRQKKALDVMDELKRSRAELLCEVDERKRAERQVRVLNEELEQRVKARTAELGRLHGRLVHNERMAALGVIGAGVAHELNNPIMGILNQIQYAMAKMPHQPRAAEALDSALCNARRCVKIVRELLTYSRQATVDEEPTRGAGDLNSAARAALELAQQDLATAGLDVELQLVDDLSGVMLQDGKILQVALNLVLNARDAMAESPRRKLLLKTEDRPEAGVLTVRDSGPGMEEAIRSRIFEPFFTTKAPGEGAGLGLSLCKNIVEGVGGRIEVRSSPGDGSTFTVVIPKAKPACAPHVPCAPEVICPENPDEERPSH